MKFSPALLSLPALAFFSSCESTDSRRAGGAAFDDSHLARKLDANAPVEDEDSLESRSFSEWRGVDPTGR